MKKVPEIFVNKLKKNISNNKEVYYSYNDDNVYEEEIIPNEYDLQQKINKLFKSNDFIYKKKFEIKTKDGIREYIIISKSYDYLLCIDVTKIYIKDIIDIK